MKYPGFIGPTYTGRSSTPAGDRCINLYPESNSGASNPENQYSLLSTPGHELFVTLPAHRLQQIYTEPATDRVFAIAEETLFEIYSNKTYKAYGKIDTGYFTLASNSKQIMITCAGTHTGWIFTLSTNELTKITSEGFLGADSVSMLDNYFVVRRNNSRQFQISSIEDGLTWDALDIASAEGGPDSLVGNVVDHRELWLFGSRHAEIFIDSGDALFPFTRLNSTFIEQGLAASESLIQLDNTIYWLGQNQHGWARVFMANGYTPIGVSNRSVEYWFNQYAKNGTISDAKAYGYQDEDGHTFYVITFPSATSEVTTTDGVSNNVVNGATWVYDVSEKMWHERQYLSPTLGKVGASLGIYHTFGFGKHLVGGGDITGNIYNMSTEVYTDNGKPIRRVRRAPHLVDELKTISYDKFRLSCQVGNIPVNDLDTNVALRTSNDGGMTWSNEYVKSLGSIGNYSQILEWRMLGRSMRRVFEISTTVKAAVCWIDSFLQIKEGR